MGTTVAPRGVEAVELVIAAQQQRDVLGLGEPQPLSAEALETLRLPNGKPLSPSMKRWLAFDASWLPWFQGESLRSFTLDELVTSEFDEMFGGIYQPLAQKKLPAACLKLLGGSDSRRLLYLGEADPSGEYPVLWIDTDDVPAIGLYSPDFGAWLLEEAGLLQGFERKSYESLADHDGYADAMDAAAQANLGGVLTLELGDEGFPAAQGEATQQFKPFPEETP